MTSHSFRVGDVVHFAEKRFGDVTWSGEYDVMDLLDAQASEPQYQIRCTDQSHHRIVGEHEIKSVPFADCTRSDLKRRPMIS